MAYSIRKEKVVKYRDEENKQPLVYFEFNCDEVADLPIGMIEEKEIAQGSIAWVISTGEFYGYTSTSSWVNQTTLEAAINVSSKNALLSRRKTSLDIPQEDVVK